MVGNRRESTGLTEHGETSSSAAVQAITLDNRICETCGLLIPRSQVRFLPGALVRGCFGPADNGVIVYVRNGTVQPLLDSAAAEGARQSRSAKQQLDHWARVGRAVSSRHSATRRKVEAALAGELELTELSVEEGVVFNAAAGIQESLADANYGQVLAGRASPRSPSTRTGRSSSTVPTAARSL